MGDGAMLGRSPCSSVVFMGASLASRVITTIHQYPLIAALDPTLSWEVEPSRASPNLYLSSEISGENACLAPGTSELASDLNPMESDTGPNLPKPPHLQLPPSLWQLLIANGVGPSTSQPSVAGGTVPSAHKPHVVSRVASRRWASTGEGKGASGTLPCAAGGGRAAHSQQCTVTYGRSVCWGQPSGISRVPPGVYRSSAAKVSQQPSVAREETTQKTPSPNHKRASAATRERTNKSTPGPLRAASMSKMSLTQPQIPKACDITLGLLPGSMVPGHRWAFKTQADPSVFPAPPGNKLAHTLTRLAVPRQERNRTQGTVASTYCPQERVTGHILTELVASLPQGPDNDLPGSLSQGSTDYGLNVSNSQSSLPSCSSLSLSSMSVASLTAVDLVEEESWEANLDGEINLDTLLSGEAVGRPQKPRDREETKKVGRGHTTPRLYHQPSAGSKLIPILHQSSVSGRVTLSVHWGSDDQDDGDVSSGQSSMGLKESLSQKSYRTGLTRSLSLDNVPTTHEQTSMATRLTSSLSQPSVVSKVAPNPGQPLTVSRVAPSPSELPVSGKVTPSLTEPSIASKVTLSLGQTSITGGVATNLARPSVTNAVAPNLAQASMTGGVVPSLAQPSVTSGIAPSLTRPSITCGVVPSLAQASVTGRVAPSLSQASVTGRVAPSLSQASVTGRVAPSLSQASVTGRVTPNLTWPSVTRGVAPSLAWPSVTHGVAPSLTQASATSGVSPSLARPSVTGGLAPNLVQASVTGGVAPSLAQGSMTGGVTPRLAQPSMTSGVAPSPARPSVTSGVAPSLAQASMTGGVTPSLAQASMTGGVTPSLTQLSVTSGVAPSLAQGSMTGGVTPSLAQPSVTSGVAPSLAQAFMTGGVAPSLAQVSMTGGVTPSLAQASMTGGVAPSLTQLSVTSGVTPSLAQASMTGGVTPSLTRPSVTSGVAPSLAQASVTSGVVPSLVQASVTSGVAPSLAQASMASGVTPSLARPSVTSGVAPSLAQASMTGGVAPSLAQASMTGGVAPSLTQLSVTSGVTPSLAQASMTGGVTPSLARPSVTSGVAPSLAQASMTGGVTPSLAQASMTGGVAPSLTQLSVTSGVTPSLAQASMTGGVTPSLARPSVTSGVAPSLAQASVTSGVVPSLVQASVTSGVAPSLAQASMASGVTPSLARPSVTSGVTPSLVKPSMTDGVDPTVAQPPVTGAVAPSPAQASMACVVASSLSQPAVTGGVAPSLAHPSMIGGIAPSLGQPSVACVVAPSLGPPSVACVVVSTLAQPFVANRGPLSLFQPSVIGGAGCTVGQSDWMPKVGSNVPSRVDAVASSLHHPSFVTEIPAGTSCPPTTSSMGQDLNQSSVATETALCQEPVMVDGVASNPQAPEFSEVPLAFHQPLSVSGGHPNITEHSAVTLSAPNIYQTSGASGEDSCLDRGTSISPGALFRGMAASISPGAMAASMFPNMSRGTLAAGMFLSMSPGPMSPGMTGSVCQGSVTTGMGPNQFQVVSGMAPIAFPASVAGAPLIHEQAIEVGPGFSRASVPNRLGMRPFRFSQANADPTMSQVNVDLPVSLNHQHPPVSTVVASGYQQADAFSQEPLMGTASGLVPGSVATRMPAALAPATAASGVAPSLPPGSVIRGVGQSLPPGPVISGVPPRLPPSYVISGVAPTFPAGSVICSISHSLPPGSVISGMGQGLPPEPMASAVAPSFPPGSAASREPPSLTAASGGGGKRQNLSMRPSVSFTAPSLIPGSVSNETDTNVSPGSVASSVFPTSVAGELNQGLVLGSTANAAGVPSTVRNVAQSLPQGSMLVGITPRPYHGALAGEGSIAPFQASHTTSLAQLHPQGLEASDTTRRGHQVPTVLQRASQLNHTLETMPFEATDDQAVMKPEGLDKGLSQVSISSGDSMVLDATPWMFHSPLSGDINDSHEFLPDSQRPLLEEVVPNQTESLTSGMAPVPPQPLNVANHSMAGSATPTLQQRSATSWRPPSSHFVTGSWVPSVLMESVRAPGAPLAQQASMAHIIPQSPLVAHIIPQSPSVAHIIPQSPPVAHIIPQSPSVAHIIPQSPSVVHIIPQSPTVTHIMSQDPPVTQVPQSPAYNMGASTIVSGSPKLAHSSPTAFSLHPGSITGMGTPSTSQRSGTTHKASHVSLYPSSTSGMASDGFQVAAVPRAHQKPVSGDLVQNNHKFLGSRKSYRSMHGYSVSDMLDSNIAKVVPLHEVQEHTYRSSQESPKHSKSAPPVVTPIIRTTEVAHNTATSRLHPGLRRVSLGYESSPDGSRRPLLAQESMEGSLDFRSAGAPVDSDRASLTPTVLQGPVDAGIAGGQAWNSAVPSVAVGPMSSAVAPGGVWDLARASVPWDTVGREAAADPRQSGELVASMQAVEKIIIHAVVTIQACARGYLVRRTVKVWHQWAVIIQAAWRGYRVRRDLARLSRAATTIQAVWRGFLTRRPETQQTMLPAMWCKMGSRTRSGSDHRCFQSCQPHICALCQSLSPRLGSPPSVVMLVGSSPRTCHMCGHTLPTRVVHGMGRGSTVQASLPWGCATQMNSRSPRLSRRRIKAATAIQSAWRGFSVRRRLKQQQMAAKMLQATWRGHRTRASLTTDALLGPEAWDSSQHMQWPGV
ncbi:IQ domain-containing protein N isoform X1 [Canis lupus baileyi]|uniref:IQ domain-containing protein N isoform X1 n=1 Tax=Canis lupus baileyi TaxID=143281 RepID=UPI003B979471